MKIIRKITKFDKILQSIQKEHEEIAKEREKMQESSNDTGELAALLETKEEEFDDTKKIGIKETARQTWFLLSGVRRKLPTIFLLMSINSFMAFFSISLIIPFVLLLQNTAYISSNADISHLSLIKQLIIEFSRYLYHSLNLTNPNTLVIMYGIAFIVLFILRSFFGVFINYIITIYSANFTRHLSGKIFSVLLYMSYVYYLGKTTVKTIYAMSLADKTYGVIVGMFTTINDFMLMGILGIGIAIWSPSIMFIAAGVFLITFGIYKISHLELKRIGLLELNLGRRKSQNIYQGIHNFVFSRLFHAEPFFLRLFHKIVDYNIPMSAYKGLIKELPRVTIEILLTLSFVGYAVFVVMRAPESTEDIMTTAAVLAGAVIKLMPASLRLTGYLSTLAGDQLSIDAFYKEYTGALSHKVDEGEHEHIPKLLFQDRIEIKNVSYAYPEFNESGNKYTYEGSKNILNNISLTIKKGEKIGLIGGSGGGKTTLMNLLMAFLEPQSGGDILVDGKSIYSEMRAWHKNIGYVPQDTMLMASSVRENVAFGEEPDKINNEKVKESLIKAHLWDVIDELPQKTLTFIGDSGKRFSGGQRQRLGIARALYRDPDVLFFDEATSHLDQTTEKEVQKAIDSVDKEKTVIVVAHRLNTLEKCDRIYCIDSGCVVFEGTYKQMMKKYGNA